MNGWEDSPEGPRWGEKETETTHAEMTAILATDLGVPAEAILGFATVIAIRPDAVVDMEAAPDAFMPVVRTSMSAHLTTYLLTVAAAETLLRGSPMGPDDFCHCHENDDDDPTK